MLSNPRIIKVGRCVTADLKYLQEACKSSVPFVGGVDLAKLAKDRLVVTSARISLGDLTAAVLNKRLNKNVSERVSSAWEDADLSDEQIRYAALDVHASLSIYHELMKIQVPSPLPTGPLDSMMPILLFNNDRTRLLARGVISLHTHDDYFGGIHITPSRCVIQVDEVLVPGAIIANGTSSKKQLQEHGVVPFQLVCLRNHVRQSNSMSILSQVPPTPAAAATVDHIPTDGATDDTSDFVHSIITETQTNSDPDSAIGTLLLQSLHSEDDSEPSQSLNNYEVDSGSQAEGQRILLGLSENKWVELIRSRVIKDPFHVFNMFYISAAHGLLHEFATALRDAIFIPDAADKARIVAWGQSQTPPLLWDTLVRSRPKWLWR
jgi:hypothetical protein